MWPQVFKIRPVKAWSAVVTSVVAMAASLYCIAIAPWYLLPFAWAFSGTAFTGVRPCWICCQASQQLLQYSMA